MSVADPGANSLDMRRRIATISSGTVRVQILNAYTGPDRNRAILRTYGSTSMANVRTYSGGR